MNIVPYNPSGGREVRRQDSAAQGADGQVDEIEILINHPLESTLQPSSIPLKMLVRIVDPILSRGIKNACEGCQGIIPYRFQFWKSSSPPNISDTPLNAAAQSVQESSSVESPSRSLIEDHVAWRQEMECILYRNRPAESSRERAFVSGAGPSLIVSQSSIVNMADRDKKQAINKIKAEIRVFRTDVEALQYNTQCLNEDFLRIFITTQDGSHPIMTEEWVRNTLTVLKTNISQTVKKLEEIGGLTHIPFIDFSLEGLGDGGEDFKKITDDSWRVVAQAKLEIIAVYRTYVQVFELSNASINLKAAFECFTSPSPKNFAAIADKIEASQVAVREARRVLEASVQSEGSQDWEKRACEQTQIGIDHLSGKVLEATKTVLKELTILAGEEIQKLVQSGNIDEASAKLKDIEDIERSVCGPVTDLSEPSAFGDELDALKAEKDALVAQIATTKRRQETRKYRITAAVSGTIVGSLAYGALTLIGFGINRFSQLR